MKKIVLLATGLIFFAATRAQEVKEPHHRGKMKGHHEMMSEKLNLTEAQKTQMKAINEDFRKKMEDLKKNENITVKEWKTQMKALRDDHKSKMQNVLTREQKDQVEKMKLEQKSKHEAGEKMRMEKMKTELGLSDDQVAKLQKNRSEIEQKMKIIREDKSLDESQKKEAMKELMKANKESMKSILTEEQMKKMKENRELHNKKDDRKKEI